MNSVHLRLGQRRCRARFFLVVLQDVVDRRAVNVIEGRFEEAGFAYKSVDEVAEATEIAGLSKRVAHIVPVGNVKG